MSIFDFLDKNISGLIALVTVIITSLFSLLMFRITSNQKLKELLFQNENNYREVIIEKKSPAIIELLKSLQALQDLRSYGYIDDETSTARRMLSNSTLIKNSLNKFQIDYCLYLHEDLNGSIFEINNSINQLCLIRDSIYAENQNSDDFYLHISCQRSAEDLERLIEAFKVKLKLEVIRFN